MKIETHPQEDHQVKLNVEVEADLLEKAKRQAAKKLAKKTRIPGFRPGKAPYAMVVRYVGEANVLQDAMDHLLEDIYPKAIEEAEISPYGPGSLLDFETDPPSFEFMVPLAPEVTLGDYKAIELAYEPPEVTEEEVQSALRDAVERDVNIKDVERAAEVGDVVYASMVGVDSDAEGEDEPLFNEENMPIYLETEEPEFEWPFKGFSRKVIGLKRDESSSFAYTFPEDYEINRYQGKTIQFEVNIKEVKERVYPEITDEYVQALENSEFETAEDFIADVREGLVSHKSEHYIEDYNEQLLDLAVADATIKFPPQMLEEEISNLIEQMKSRLSYQGLNWDAYLNTRGIDEESIRAESSEAAEKRLKKNLVLFQIADEEDIQVEPDEIQDTVNQTLKMYIDVLGESETQKLLNSQEQLQNMTNNILSQKIVSKTLALLKAIATGEELEEEIQTEEASGDSAETSEATEPVAEETEEPEKEE